MNLLLPANSTSERLPSHPDETQCPVWYVECPCRVIFHEEGEAACFTW